MAELDGEYNIAEGAAQGIPPLVLNELRKEAELASLTKWQIDNTDSISELRLYLTGKTTDPETGGEIVSPYGTQLVNEKGTEAILNLLRPYVSKNVILSNFTEEEVYTLTKQALFKTTILLYSRWYEYEIHPPNLDVVLSIVETFVFSSLCRPMAEGERKFLRTSVRYTESNVTRPLDQNGNLEKRGGLFGFFK